MDYRTNGQAYGGAPSRALQPLAEVPANQQLNRSRAREASRPPTKHSGWGAGPPAAQPFTWGFNGMGVSVSTLIDGVMNNASFNTGPAIVGVHDNIVTFSDGRRIVINGGISHVTVNNGHSSINGVPVEQLLRQAEQASSEAARHQAVSSDRATAHHRYLPPPPAMIRQGYQAAPTPAPGTKAAHASSAPAPSFLPQQSARSSSIIPPHASSSTAISTTRPPSITSGTHGQDLLRRTEPRPRYHPIERWYSKVKQEPSSNILRQKSEPGKVTVKEDSSTAPRYKLKPATSPKAPGAPRKSLGFARADTVNRVSRQSVTAPAAPGKSLAIVRTDTVNRVSRPSPKVPGAPRKSLATSHTTVNGVSSPSSTVLRALDNSSAVSRTDTVNRVLRPSVTASRAPGKILAISRTDTVNRVSRPSVTIPGAPGKCPGISRTDTVNRVSRPSVTAREAPRQSLAISRTDTVNRVSRTLPAHHTGQSRLTGAPQKLLRTARLPVLPPVLASSGEESDTDSDAESFPEQSTKANMDFFDMDDEPQSPGVESRPNAMRELQELLQKMPDIDVPPEDRANTPVEMCITLMEHQKVALKWLKDQENNRSKKGGLLADTMGLGKTIEALALILANKPPASGPKATLIVAPLALLRQWKREIEAKIKPAHRLDVFIYHGREKKTKKADKLYEYDIVITTYETIASEHRRRGINGQRRSPLFTDPRGFFRIILDEAHKIKNRNTACSKAVVDLRAEFRLCMTGTPFMNNTAEIFSLIRFLKIAPYCDWNHFNKDIEIPLRKWEEDEKAAAMKRLQVLFRSITLRRSKDSILDGRPILTLPKLTITPTSVELDEEQRAYYTAKETSTRLLVNKYLKRGRLQEVITFILVLLTRLRQCCDHPWLSEKHGIPDEASLNSKQMVQLALRFDPGVVREVLRKKDFVCPICEEAVEIAIIIFPCGHDICPECFSSMMQVSEAAKNAGQSIIRGAGDMETKCPHDGCQSEVLPNKVVCHDHFLDAHSPGSASQALDENSSDVSDDCLSSDEDEEDSEVSDEDIRDFIVSDGDEDSQTDSDESEDGKDSDQEPERNIKVRAGRSCVGRTPTSDDACDSGHEPDTPADAGEGADAEELNAEEGISRVEDESEFDTVDEVSEQPPANQASPSAEEESGPVSKYPLPKFDNTPWGLIHTRLRDGKFAKLGSESDSDSDSFPSLSGLEGTEKAKHAIAPASASKPVAAKRKRGLTPQKRRGPKKRARTGAEEEDTEVEEQERPRRSRKRGKKGGKKNKKGKAKTMAELRKIGSTSKAGKVKYFARLRRDWESSAKVDVTVALLRKIREESPGEKTLVFSCWTSFLDLLEIGMEEHKFRYLRYDGSMNFDERDENVKTFSEDPRETILLVSLMAGNAGLNLVAASHVIILEPFWNPFVEDQAIDRAHRIGQKKEVQVHKLLVPESVEDRILQLQNKKRNLVNTALSEEGAQGAGRLTIGELRGLFGLR